MAKRRAETKPAELRSFMRRYPGTDTMELLIADLAGVHHGLRNRCDPGRMVKEGVVISLKQRIPNRWDAAIDKFSRSKVLPEYLGAEYCKSYGFNRRDESRRFHNVVSNTDFDWYMRAV